MSDDEVMRSDEEGSESEKEETPKAAVKRADEGPSEAQLAMQRRRQQQSSTTGLDEEALALLEQNRKEREKMEEEIRELRERSERRKREREEEEKLLAERRAEEEARRKAEEEERRRKKQEEEERKKQERAKKMAEFEKWRNPTSPNFVITRKDRPVRGTGEEEGVEGGEKKSKEQLEAEKRAILKQRIQPLEIDGFDAAKLAEKARELHAQVYRLESEKYDLERRFKSQLSDMMELAERARNMNKVGKHGSIKRVQLSDGETDKFQERFAGCPAKIVMYSQYERQKDKRPFKARREVFAGPVFGFPPPRITPQRKVIWNPETGQPEYKPLNEE